MSLELTTEVAPDITLQDIVELALANGHNIKVLMEHTDYVHPEPVVDTSKDVTVRFETVEANDGFDVQVWIENLHNVGHFSAFEGEANFGPGVNFVGIEKGEVISHFYGGANTLDGHPKEGRFGYYTSSNRSVDGTEDGNEDPVLLCTLQFMGPASAGDFMEFEFFRIALSSSYLPVAANPRIK